MVKYTFDDLVKMGPFSAIDIIIGMSMTEKKQILDTMTFKHHSAVVESENSNLFIEKNKSLIKLLENVG